MGGWSSSEMVKRYAHLTAGHLVDYAEKISADTKLTQSNVVSIREGSKSLKEMVARDRIELPTRGFSERIMRFIIVINQ